MRLCLCETARQPARGPDLVLSPVRWSVVLHWYFGDVSRMAVAFWCGAVFFPRFSVDGRSQREFGGGFLRVYVGGRRAPYCCLSFWLCSLFFLYVVFHDYLLIFIPSLSMKWAPSCAGSFKKKHGVQVKIMRFTSFTIKRLITSEHDTIRSLICYYIYSMYSNFKQPPQSLYDKFVSCVSKD